MNGRAVTLILLGNVNVFVIVTVIVPRSLVLGLFMAGAYTLGLIWWATS